MNISGIVVHTSPDKIDRVRTQLEKIPGVEVHAASVEGKMVVTIEKPSDRDAADIFEEIGHIPGILSTAMVYHHFEPDTEATA
jgi:nitrate reductase NapD